MPLRRTGDRGAPLNRAAPTAEPSTHAALAALVTGIVEALGPRAVGVTLSGSLAAGDFCPARSDLDLLVILSGEPDEPDEATLAALRQVHDDFVVAFPTWRDRVEAEYLTPAAVAAAQGGADALAMIRISPGEPIHLTPATRHYLVNWHGAQTSGQSLYGPPARELLPPIDTGAMLAVVAEHLANWPDWVLDHETPGSQAYAVLTVCRGRAALSLGRQVSKRAAADFGLRAWPHWRGLIEWARTWWFDGGSDDEPSRYAEVVSFVAEIAPAAD